VFPGATSRRVLRQSKVGLVNSVATCYVEAEVLLSLPDSKDLRDFARLPTTIDHGFEPRSEYIELKNLKWPSFSPSYNKKGKIILKHEIKKESTHGSHVILLTCY